MIIVLFKIMAAEVAVFIAYGIALAFQLARDQTERKHIRDYIIVIFGSIALGAILMRFSSIDFGAVIGFSFIAVSLSRKAFSVFALLTSLFLILAFLQHGYDFMALARGCAIPFITYGFFSYFIMDKPL